MKTITLTRRGIWASFLLLFACLMLASSYAQADPGDDPFITTWEGNKEEPIIIPIQGTNLQYRYCKKGTTSYSNWITPPTAPEANKEKALKIKFPENAVYRLEIKGNIDQIAMSYYQQPLGSVSKLLTIEQWGNSKYKKLFGAFANCGRLEIPESIKDAPDLTACSYLTSMFYACSKLKKLHKKWDLGGKVEVINTAYMFSKCFEFNEPTLKDWDVSKIQRFEYMFNQCSKLDVDLSNWDVSQSRSCRAMFLQCRNFRAQGLEKWATRVTKVEDFTYMFLGCNNVNFSPNDWELKSVRKLESMFDGCINLGSESKVIDVTKWTPYIQRVSNCTALFKNVRNFTGKGVEGWFINERHNAKKLSRMFAGCSKFNADLSRWKVKNVESFSGLFDGCIQFTGMGLKGWDVSSATDLSDMFKEARLMTEKLDDWIVKKVKKFTRMFSASDPQTDFTKWDVSAGEDFSYMFNNCSKFTGESLAGWTVKNGIDFSYMFSSCSEFRGDLKSWSMDNAQNISNMFAATNHFNAPISYWNVENVIDASGLFRSATAFNQPLNSWKFRNLQDISEIFQKTENFDQDLSKWNVSQVKKMDSAFYGAKKFTGKGLDKWNVGECRSFNSTFRHCETFTGDLSNWDMSSALELANMFGGASVGKTNFRNWDVSNVITMEGMFWDAIGDIEDVTGWDTHNCENMQRIFQGAKGMQHPIENWDFSALETERPLGLAKCGMGVDAYNRTIEAWIRNTTSTWNIKVDATDLYYSNKTMHDKLSGRGYNVYGDKFTGDNLSISTNKMRLKVGEKKPLTIKFSRTSAKLQWSAEPKENISYNETTHMVEGLKQGRAKVRVKDIAPTSPQDLPLHTFCDVDVYLAITDLKFDSDEYILAIGDELDLRSKMTIEPADATYPDRIKFTIQDPTQQTYAKIEEPTSGKVKGLKEGKVTVTIETFDQMPEKDPHNPNAPVPQYEKVTKTITIKVVNVPVVSLRLVPIDILIGIGQTQKVKVFFTPANSTNKKYKKTLECVGNSGAVQIVEGEELAVKGVKEGVCDLVVTSEDQEKVARATVRVIKHYLPVAKVKYLNSRKLRFAVGSKNELSVKVEPTNASNHALEFVSSDPEIATVNQNGIVEGLKEGVVIIKVSSVPHPEAFDECEIEFYNEPVTGIVLVGGEDVKVGKDKTRHLKYQIIPENATDKSIVCSVEDNQYVKVVDSEKAIVSGLSLGGPVDVVITAHGTGSTPITATYKVTCVLDIPTTDINVPSTYAMFIGREEELPVTFVPENSTDQDLTITSSRTDIVEIVDGKLVAREVGVSEVEVTLTSTLSSQTPLKKTCVVTVKPHILAESVTLQPQKLTIGITNEYQMQLFAKPEGASKIDVIWFIDDQPIATPNEFISFDPKTLIVKALQEGKAKLSVALKATPDVRSTCEITIISPKIETESFVFDQPEYTIDYGATLNLNEHLTFTPENATDRWMDWISAQQGVVSVSGGFVKALEANEEGIQITAALHSDPNKTATCLVKVKAPILPTKITFLSEHLKIKVGDVLNLVPTIYPETATDRLLDWACSDADVLAFDQTGRIEGRAKGRAIITATLRSNPKVQATCIVDVLESTTNDLITSFSIADVDLIVKKSAALQITVAPEGLSPDLIFEGVDNTKFIIARDYTLTAIEPTDAPVTVKAYLKENPNITATFTVTIRPEVAIETFELNHKELTVYQNNEAVVRALVNSQVIEGNSVSWTSDNASVCTITDGIVAALVPGTATITATYNGHTAECKVEVRAVGSIDETSVNDTRWEGITVTPNPFANYLRIANNNLIEGTYTLLDILGNNLRGGILTSQEMVLETSELPAGIYILRLQATNGEIKIFKLLKQ